MRLWSLHPKYLDAKGLVALWREGLLAQKVLAGRTRGYRHHPQLIRFHATRDPLSAIGHYLSVVVAEATVRGYKFDRTKILKRTSRAVQIPVTRGQLRYEREHLIQKLKNRSPQLHKTHMKLKRIVCHPSFKPVSGKIHDWEKVQ